ncbi:hypothetical protein GOV04_04905 [Candidatus Woesearchaeota archaeon]|nr:hypothetical protein [Candidatus Woesearchaeota archaeon]
MNKKGFGQADWAISLALFLLYITWFFFFIQPIGETNQNNQLLLDVIERNFFIDNSDSITQTPLFIKSDYSATKEPLKISLQDNFSKTLTLKNTYCAIDDNQLLLIPDLVVGTNMQLIVEDTTTCFENTAVLDLVSSNTSTTLNDLKIEYVNGLLNRVRYDDQTRLVQYEVYINNNELSTQSGLTQSYNNSFMHSRHSMQNSENKHQTLVYATKKRLYNNISTGISDKTIKVTFNTYNYSTYWANPSQSAALNYDFDNCQNFNWDYLNLYDGSTAISLILSEQANIELCTENNDLTISITTNLTRSLELLIVLHSGNHLQTVSLKDKPTQEYGASQTLSGLSTTQLTIFNNSDYTSVKNSWTYPQQKHFAITVDNSQGEQIIKYTPTTPQAQDVSVRQANCNLIAANGTIESCTTIIKIW